jgi:hypothetical protein
MYSGNGRGRLFREIREVGGGMLAAHFFEDFVRAMLQREMQEAAQFWIVLHQMQYFVELRIEFRGAEAQSEFSVYA